MDKLKKRQLIARKRGYGPDYVNLFVKHHKEKMREFARQRGICNPIDVGLNKWGLERRMMLKEEMQGRRQGRRRVQMQVLNEHVAALCASECLNAFFSLPNFKCNIIALLTDCILYMKGMVVVRNMPRRWLVQGMRRRS